VLKRDKIYSYVGVADSFSVVVLTVDLTRFEKG
jgi:hypothetical protein